MQEWFKNRRKKDRLLQDRALGKNLPKGNQNRKSTNSENSAFDQLAGATPAELVVEIPPDGGGIQVDTESGSTEVDVGNRQVQDDGGFVELHIVS